MYRSQNSTITPYQNSNQYQDFQPQYSQFAHSNNFNGPPFSGNNLFVQQQIHNHLNNYNQIHQNIYNVQNKISINIRYDNELMSNERNLQESQLTPKNVHNGTHFAPNDFPIGQNFQLRPKSGQNFQNFQPRAVVNVESPERPELPKIQKVQPNQRNPTTPDPQQYNSLDDLNTADENYQFYNEKAVDVPESFEKEAYQVLDMKTKMSNFKRRICPPKRDMSPKNKNDKKKDPQIVYIKVRIFLTISHTRFVNIYQVFD